MKQKAFYLITVLPLIVFVSVAIGYLATARRPTVAAPAPPPPVVPAPEQGEWNTFHGDSALRGIADTSFPDTLDILWRLKTRAPVEQTPVVSQGRLFVATARGEIIAADLNGHELWARELFTGETVKGEPVRRRIEAPLACFDGIVLAGTDEGMLFAFDAASGHDLWSLTLEGPVRGAPNGLAGRAYVVERSNGSVVCIDTKTGQVLGRGEGVGRSDAALSASREAVIYGSCACALHICSPADGKRLRDIKLDSESQVAGGVAIADGHVLSGCRSGKVFEADIATGATVWSSELSTTEIYATPAVNAEWVIASSYDGFVYALERKTGKTRWRYDTQGMPLSPVIAGDKVIVSADGELLLIRLADGTKVWSLKAGDQITEAAVTQHQIYVGSQDGTVIAFGASKTPRAQ